MKIGDRYGYINRKGRYVINLLFDFAEDFSDSLAAVRIGDKEEYSDILERFIVRPGKWGYINREGQYVINPQFDDAESFSEDLAFVDIGDKEGYINREGQLVIEPTYEYGSGRIFSEGLAALWVGDSDRYVSTRRDNMLSIHNLIVLFLFQTV